VTAPAGPPALGGTGAAQRAARSDAAERWLAGLLPDVPDVALVAVGSLARRDSVERSDLDVVLVHRGRHDGGRRDGGRSGRADVAAVADAVWYPVWDAGVGLDHSVRTVAEAVAVARDDVKAALGLLDARYVAGDRTLAEELGRAVREAWRADAVRQLAALEELTVARWQSAGEIAALVEPDLKEARGGLRDVLALRGIAYAQVADPPRPPVRAAYERLLDVRGALHRVSGRALDRLLLQEQAPVAAELGLDRTAGVDAVDLLLRGVVDDARTIAYAADQGWRQVGRWLSGRRRRWSPRRPATVRRPLAEGVVEQDGEVVLARETDLSGDPVLGLRVAAAAATAALPVSEHTLERLAASPPMPRVWPEAATRTLVTLLGAGRPLVGTWEAFDRHGLVTGWLPEWERVRSLPQRNPVHRFTVDRHLVETAAAASAFTRRVSRPDLLLLGALVHDIGKGLPGDHSEAGAAVARGVCRRLGLDAADLEVVVTLVRHHLLLPDTATRRDLDDPVTVAAVARAVADSPDTLDLLHALTEADAQATGPAAWSDWKARLVDGLVSRTHALLGDGSPPPPVPPGPDLMELAGRGTLAVRVGDGEVVVVAPDARGLLSRAAGVLSLHRLDVLSADAATVSGSAVLVFGARPRFGTPPEPELLSADLRRAVTGQLPLAERLSAREQSARPRALPPAPPRVLWLQDAATDATVLELRAADGPGLLYRVAAALEAAGVEVRSARVSTLGADVVDAFYLRGPYDDPGRRGAVEAAVLAAAAPR